MYLRDMGSVALLSREGEVAIAKRIEAGREIMLAGLCESPLTFQAITIWGDELKAGKIYLRDIIDLDATHAGSDAEGMPAPVIGPDDLSIVGASVSGESGRLSKMQAPTIALATQVKPADERAAAEEHGRRRHDQRKRPRRRGGRRRIGSRLPPSRPSSNPR